MIPDVISFNEWYPGPNQLQALDTLGYQSAELQASGLFVVARRREDEPFLP
jgi:hypothetical protein